MQGLIYISSFLTAGEELAIVSSIDSVPQSRWISAGERRMLNFGGWPGQARVAEVRLVVPVLCGRVKKCFSYMKRVLS
jgi:hypothetical protein